MLNELGLWAALRMFAQEFRERSGLEVNLKIATQLESNKLDDNQRRSILLAFVDGFTHVEIAERMAAPLGSVKSWVRRGLMTLRSCLES